MGNSCQATAEEAGQAGFLVLQLRGGVVCVVV